MTWWRPWSSLFRWNLLLLPPPPSFPCRSSPLLSLQADYPFLPFAWHQEINDVCTFKASKDIGSTTRVPLVIVSGSDVWENPYFLRHGLGISCSGGRLARGSVACRVWQTARRMTEGCLREDVLWFPWCGRIGNPCYRMSTITSTMPGAVVCRRWQSLPQAPGERRGSLPLPPSRHSSHTRTTTWRKLTKATAFPWTELSATAAAAAHGCHLTWARSKYWSQIVGSGGTAALGERKNPFWFGEIWFWCGPLFDLIYLQILGWSA